MLRSGETNDEMMRVESQRKLLAEWLDPDSIEIVRGAVYRFHAIIAEEWWRGRVGIAGDAAHQTPPFLGQGMCAGIRDASNLAWKLEWVLKGRASPALLESYGSERAPHVRAFIERAILTGNIICTQDETLAKARDEKMLAQRAEPAIVPLSADMPPAGPGFFAPGNHPLVGRFAPQPRVQTRQGDSLLDDLTGTGFRLVLRDERGWPDRTRRGALEALGGTTLLWTDDAGEVPQGGARFVDRDGGAAACFDRHDLHAYLVRPDHGTFGVARTPEQVAPLVDALGARLGRS
jgi:3-(3-hydroxy-phenyl)propionate hydroxylase